MEYSIWIVPQKPLYTELSLKIVELAKKYQSPPFEPHMALIGKFKSDLADIKKAVSVSVKGVTPFSLSMGTVSFSTTYYQSVFVRVDSTAPLLDLNITLKKHLHLENTIYMPHMSLLYGDQTMQLRESIANSVTMTKHMFLVDEILIKRITPDPSSWETIEKYKLVY